MNAAATLRILVASGWLLSAVGASAQLFNFSTPAGLASAGSADGAVTNSQFSSPSAIAGDSAGNLFVADNANHVIRKISTNGTVVTIAGTAGVSGSGDGTGAAARFHSPMGITVNAAGTNVFVADTANHAIRKLAYNGTNWIVSTFAGLAGAGGTANGSGGSARFFAPEGLALDAAGNLFVADTWNHSIRKITPAGTVSTYAGTAGTNGTTDGAALTAQFYQPQAVALDAAGNVFVADTANHTVRKIATGGTVTTVAGSAGNYGSADATGTNALFYSPQGIAVDAGGNLFVADHFNHTIRAITPGRVVTTLAGFAGNAGAANGTNSAARFWEPQGIALSAAATNTLFIADAGNNAIRQLAATGAVATVTTVAGTTSGCVDAAGAAARFFWPGGVALDAGGNWVLADTVNCTVRKVTPAGVVTTFAGRAGLPGGADGTGTNATFNALQAVARDSAGNLFIADSLGQTIRKITTGGSVSTFAGTAGIAGSADGTGTNAQFFAPQAVAVDGADNLFVSDMMNHTIRRITPAGVVTTVAGLPGHPGCADGTNSLVLTNKAARLNRPAGLALDPAGNLWVADSGNHVIRKISPAGTNWVTGTVAGLPGVFGSADGANSVARFLEPLGVAADAAGNIFVADSGNHSIRRISPAGTNWNVITVGGFPGSPGSADGAGIAARFCFPAGVAVGGAGRLAVADAGNSTLRLGSMITNTPPVILAQPQSLTVNQGGQAVFTVVVAAAPAVYYQWYFNGAALTGANSASLNLASAQLPDAGQYAVLVATPGGTVLSSNAVLTVNPLPFIITQPSPQVCCPGYCATFTVLAAPEPLTYQWWKNGVAMTNSTAVSGATTPTMVISSATANDAAWYTVTVTNLAGGVAGTPVTLTVAPPPPLDAVTPVAWWRLNEGFGSATLDASGNGHYGTLTGVAWTNNGHAGIGVNFAGAGGTVAVANPFTISGDWTAAMWVFRRDSSTSSALLSGSGSVLKLEQWNNTGKVGFTVPGSADYAFSYSAPLNVWTHLAFVKVGTNISLYANGTLADANAANTNTMPLNITALGKASSDYLDALLNDVRIYNQALSPAQITNLFSAGVISPVTNTAPVITSQPADRVCLAGTNASFSVGAGPQYFGYPLAYQWRKNGLPLANVGPVNGAASATMNFTVTTTNDSGPYSVTITNASGSVTSSVAALAVYGLPAADSPAPYAWWLFNEGSGPTALDYSGNGHAGTLNTGTTWTNGNGSGNALNFNGTSNAMVTIAGAFKLAGDWTAALWVNRRDSGAGSVLLGGSTSALKLEQWNNTGKVGYTVFGSADYTLNYSAPVGVWTHLVMVKTSAGVSLYANGAGVATNTAGVTLDAAAFGRASSDWLDGAVGEVRVYNQALTAQQVTNLFSFGRASPVPPVVGAVSGGTNKFSFVFAGFAKQPYTILESTNIALAVAGWTTNSAGVFNAAGQAVFTNIHAVGQNQFYRVRSP